MKNFLIFNQKHFKTNTGSGNTRMSKTKTLISKAHNPERVWTLKEPQCNVIVARIEVCAINTNERGLKNLQECLYILIHSHTNSSP